MTPPLTPDQSRLVDLPFEQAIFLEGPAGSGKTTVAVERLRALLQSGVPSNSVLILVPQRTLATAWYDLLRDPYLAGGGVVDLLTLGGLARRTIDLYWPLVFEEAGFGRPNTPPTFLTLESAQFFMARVVRPLIDREGFFATVTIDRARLYSQIIDNLNKAAVVGFPHTELAERLAAAWAGDDEQTRIYADVQEAANRFRTFCYAHNLLDFSLQMELFIKYLWPNPLVRDQLTDRYRHLFVDNLEEDTPTTHGLLAGWITGRDNARPPDSAFLLYDTDAGYRAFLGADPDSAYELKARCPITATLNDTFVASDDLIALEDHLVRAIERESLDDAYPGDLDQAFDFALTRFHPQMIDHVAERVAQLVHEDDIPPNEIVIIAPFMSDALRFALRTRLEDHAVPVQSHRPSRALEEEPATLTLLTLARLAHPHWNLPPAHADVTYALREAIDDLDLVRAQLLTEILYRPGATDEIALQPFEKLAADAQARITYTLGARYDRLRQWLHDYFLGLTETTDDTPHPLDHFVSRLFGEILAQPDFRFHHDLDAARIAASLVESIYKFRRVYAPIVHHDHAGQTAAAREDIIGIEYLTLIQEGVIAAQYLEAWDPTSDAVLIAPAYTFLLRNRPVDYQFWLNIATRGWSDRLYQPLTQPYVLSRQWVPGAKWTDADEVRTSRENLRRLVAGLLRRCRRHVTLCMSEIDEQGFDHRGGLIMAVQRVRRHLATHNQGGRA